MAALTPDDIGIDSQGGGGGDRQGYHIGQQFWCFPFQTQTVDSGDTFQAGKIKIRTMAWIANSAGDQVSMLPDVDTSTVTFIAQDVDNQGYLLVWGKL